MISYHYFGYCWAVFAQHQDILYFSLCLLEWVGCGMTRSWEGTQAGQLTQWPKRCPIHMTLCSVTEFPEMLQCWPLLRDELLVWCNKCICITSFFPPYLFFVLFCFFPTYLTVFNTTHEIFLFLFSHISLWWGIRGCCNLTWQAAEHHTAIHYPSSSVGWGTKGEKCKNLWVKIRTI